jgi:hypothetical protein
LNLDVVRAPKGGGPMDLQVRKDFIFTVAKDALGRHYPKHSVVRVDDSSAARFRVLCSDETDTWYSLDIHWLLAVASTEGISARIERGLLNKAGGVPDSNLIYCFDKTNTEYTGADWKEQLEIISGNLQLASIAPLAGPRWKRFGQEGYSIVAFCSEELEKIKDALSKVVVNVG